MAQSYHPPRFSWQPAEEDRTSDRPLQVYEPSRHSASVPDGQLRQLQHQPYGSRAYSYIQTPIEYHQPNLSHTPNVPKLPSAVQSATNQSSATYLARQGAVSEKSEYHSSEPVAPPSDTQYAGHPALYIPPGTNHVQTPNPPQRQLPPPASPSSPGPLPAKMRFPEGPEDYPSQPAPPFTKQAAPTTTYTSTQTPDALASQNRQTSFPPASHQPAPPAAHNPGQITHPNMDLTTSGHRFTSSLCACGPPSDLPTCLTGLFCPCILYGKTAYRLHQKSQRRAPTDLNGWSATNARCGLMSLACGLWCLFPIAQRSRIRRAYGIEGSVGDDAVKAGLCCCCAVVQNEREVRTREEGLRRWAGPATGEVYKAPGQMVYAPPPRARGACGGGK